MLIRRIFPIGKLPNSAEARVFAAYIVFRTKEHVESCGNYTTLVTLENVAVPQPDGTVRHLGRAAYLPRGRVNEMEQQFRQKWAREEQQLLWRKIEDLAAPSSS